MKRQSLVYDMLMIDMKEVISLAYDEEGDERIVFSCEQLE